MDFLNMNFSKLFLEKHGKTIFDNICKTIKQENQPKYSEKYLETIFDVAFLESWGMLDNQIINFLRDIKHINNINIGQLKSVHKHSIKEIQKYIKIATENSFNEKE